MPLEQPRSRGGALAIDRRARDRNATLRSGDIRLHRGREKKIERERIASDGDGIIFIAAIGDSAKGLRAG